MEAAFLIAVLAALFIFYRLHRAEGRNREFACSLAAKDRANAVLAEQNAMLGEALRELSEPQTVIITEAASAPGRRWNDTDGVRKPNLLWDESVTYNPSTNEFLDSSGKPI